MSATSTPKFLGNKKRELTSPDLDLDSDYKKNRLNSESSISDLSDTTETEIKLTTTMASEMDTMSQESTPIPHIMIPPSEMSKIAQMLKETYRSEIEGMIDSIVKGVIGGLTEKIRSLEESNMELQQNNKLLLSKISILEAQADQAEQYSRRNCLRISGVPEENEENTDNIVLRIATDIGSSIQLPDIDRSHRIGRVNRARDRPRDIIVKLATYRARSNFYRKRTSLKQSGHMGVYINEELTRKRSGLLFHARRLLKAQRLKGAWSSDGTVLIKDNADRVHRVAALSDLVPFGYIPTVSSQLGMSDGTGGLAPASMPGPSGSA